MMVYAIPWAVLILNKSWDKVPEVLGLRMRLRWLRVFLVLRHCYGYCSGFVDDQDSRKGLEVKETDSLKKQKLQENIAGPATCLYTHRHMSATHPGTNPRNRPARQSKVNATASPDSNRMLQMPIDPVTKVRR